MVASSEIGNVSFDVSSLLWWWRWLGLLVLLLINGRWWWLPSGHTEGGTPKRDRGQRGEEIKWAKYGSVLIINYSLAGHTHHGSWVCASDSIIKPHPGHHNKYYYYPIGKKILTYCAELVSGRGPISLCADQD